MKILHVVSSMNPETGGVCKAVSTIIQGITKQKKYIENEVMCVDIPELKYINSDNFFIHALGPSKTSWSYSPKLSPWLTSNISKYKIIIVHGLWQYQSHVVYKIWRKQKIKPFLYVMPHGMLDPYFQKAKGRKLKAVRNDIIWKLIENKLINSADGLFFTCESEKFLAKESFYPYKPKKEIVVGLGIETPPSYEVTMKESLKQKCKNWNEKPFILFLSRIHKKIGVDLLIKAYQKLQNEVNELPQLIIAGPGLDSSYGKEIQKLSSTNKNLLFSGMLNGDAKWGAFYHCECFILPSHQENFGIAIVEAMACKKAVLITEKVNIWREIKNEDAGFIEEDTENGTYKLLKKWINLPIDRKEEMNINAQIAYKKYFSIEETSKKLLKELNV